MNSYADVRIDETGDVLNVIPVDFPAGKLQVDGVDVVALGGVPLPNFDRFSFSYYGTTNNVQIVSYTFHGNEVARWTFTYRNGAVADNDVVLTGALTTF